MKIGTLELVVIAIVALLVIGPNKLPEYAKKLGQAMREFKKASDSLTKEIKASLKEVTDSVSSIGKPQKAAPKAEEAGQVPAEGPAPAQAPDTSDKENPQ